jgi:hypothetical protein
MLPTKRIPKKTIKILKAFILALPFGIISMTLSAILLPGSL